ncbi:MAG: arylsulfatase [Bacteroidales bacterium]|nr:arylsulfatase [Bacteroidales bacterium]
MIKTIADRIAENLGTTGVALSCIAAVAGSCSGTGRAKEPSKPNIILIVADDLGFGDLSMTGQTKFSTPNLDQMAAEGIFLSNHYCGSTVSAPSRAALLTGKHTGHTSVRGNQPAQLLHDEEVTIAEKMKEAGYVTGAIGKWGIGHPPPTDDPRRNGFDHFFGYINMWHAHNFYPEFLYENGERYPLSGNKLYETDGKNPWINEPEGTGVAETKEQYVPFLIDEEALGFIEQNKDTAFFLYLAYNTPHANNEAGSFLNNGMEVPDYGEFADKEWPDPEKGFAQMMHNLDASVGKINNRLKELGIDENTIVIFISDNGPHDEGKHDANFFNSSGIYRGTKRDLYEGGIRTPFIAKWPAVIEPGRKSEHVSAGWDILPTLCDIAGASSPDSIDGISFLSVLRGDEENQPKHEYLYWEFYEMGGKQAVLKGNWKGIVLNVRRGNPSAMELYDISTDPSESKDVASEYPEIVKELQKIMQEAHTPLPIMSLYDERISADTPF